MPKLLRASMLQKCIACGSCMLACARMRYQSLSLDKSAIRIRTAGGFQTSPVADVCLGCTEPACAAVCSAGALVPGPTAACSSTASAASAAAAAPRPAPSAASATTTARATRSSARTAASASVLSARLPRTRGGGLMQRTLSSACRASSESTWRPARSRSSAAMTWRRGSAAPASATRLLAEEMTPAPTRSRPTSRSSSRSAR